MAALELNRLERAVFHAVGERWSIHRPGLEQQLVAAKVVSRENSGAGFFTNFEVDPSTPALVIGPLPSDYPLTSPDADVVGLAHGMGFVLWLTSGGHLDFLEGYTFGKPDDTVGLDFETVQFQMQPST